MIKIIKAIKMSIFSLNASSLANAPDQIDIDELYEQNKIRDANTLNVFTKLLKRIHLKIKTISRQRQNNTLCWFKVPTSIIGTRSYNYSDCVSFLIKKLTENKFLVKFIEPSMLLITWHNYVPSYAREKIKETMGYEVDEFGNKKSTNNKSQSQHQAQHQSETDLYSHMNYDSNYSIETHTINYPSEPKPHSKKHTQNRSQDKKYTHINTYKPSGKMMYTADMFDNLEDVIGGEK
jgi:hypothetical protein